MADTAADATATRPELNDGATIKRVAVSSFLGNFIEWFDNASYS